jgi:hypothetical protein
LTGALRRKVRTNEGTAVPIDVGWSSGSHSTVTPGGGSGSVRSMRPGPVAENGPNGSKAIVATRSSGRAGVSTAGPPSAVARVTV